MRVPLSKLESNWSKGFKSYDRTSKKKHKDSQTKNDFIDERSLTLSHSLTQTFVQPNFKTVLASVLKAVILKIFFVFCCTRELFQTLKSVKSKNLSLTYQRYTLSGCKDIEIRKFEFVTKTQFFLEIIHFKLCTPKINELSFCQKLYFFLLLNIID